MADEELVLRALDDGVLTLTLNRPERLNAFNPPLMRAFGAAIADAGRDPEARVVVITGAGRGFCAGGDIAGKSESKSENTETRKRRPDSLVQRTRWLRGNMEAVSRLYRLDKPTIAMIRGPVVSVGLGLAGACDFRIASETATFATAFATVGLTGDYGATWFLTRLLGTAKARELMFLAERRLDAAEAEDIGLISRRVSDEQLEAETMALARRLAAGPPVSLGLIKQNLNAAETQSLEQQLDLEAMHMVLAAQTQDQREALKAFWEKRPPVFTGG